MTTPATDTLEVSVRLRCFVRQEGDCWESGCPALDVYSQADDREGAKEALKEAVELWIDSCLERNTLHQALTELGWHSVLAGASPPADLQYSDTASVESAGEVLGEPFPLTITIPAFETYRLTG